jgi:hypothetical protein
MKSGWCARILAGSQLATDACKDAGAPGSKEENQNEKNLVYIIRNSRAGNFIVAGIRTATTSSIKHSGKYSKTPCGAGFARRDGQTVHCKRV